MKYIILDNFLTLLSYLTSALIVGLIYLELPNNIQNAKISIPLLAGLIPALKAILFDPPISFLKNKSKLKELSFSLKTFADSCSNNPDDLVPYNYLYYIIKQSEELSIKINNFNILKDLAKCKSILERAQKSNVSKHKAFLNIETEHFKLTGNKLIRKDS